MSKIEFTSQQKQKMATLLQDYLADELDIEIGQFDAEFFADHITQKLGRSSTTKDWRMHRVLCTTRCLISQMRFIKSSKLMSSINFYLNNL
ncbi:hypothetical protein VSF3289_03833 [Vibrio scophthalmi]|uniref:Uncharacterized protein n=1 Tax=Vibrio scophthalmi TaxID=45658 RepID=A0A1E3WFW7_9VIBR|nr:hypothetical protein VSF3289_03833 [Vibrio scophthalmi]